MADVTARESLGQALDMTTTRPYRVKVVNTAGDEAVSGEGYLAVV